MTAALFNELHDLEKLEILWQSGVHIAARAELERRYELYQVHGFYVEEI